VNWLRKVLSNPEYSFYQPLDYEEQFLGLVFNPIHTERALEMLGYLGTSAAQARLLDFAGQQAAPIEWRQTAADAFNSAIRARGLLINAEDIKRQYTRYNSSANEPVEAQRLLGSILDAIEHQATLADRSE
jgi:hypothetical protein